MVGGHGPTGPYGSYGPDCAATKEGLQAQCASLEVQLERQKLDNVEGEQRLAEARAQLATSERQTSGVQQETRQKRDTWEKQRREARISNLLGTMSKGSSSAAASQAAGTANYFGDDAFSLGAGPSFESATAARRMHFSTDKGLELPRATNSLLEVRTTEIRLRSESITNRLFGSEPPNDAAKVRSLSNDSLVP